MKRKEIEAEIEKLDNEHKRTSEDIAAGYYRLAFGCVSDAVKLLFADETVAEQIETMDLFNISEIKRKKGGEIEIKFFDRLKALRFLQDCPDSFESESNSFYSAIEKGAAALKESADE